jgi:hypothetical protein
MLPLVAYLIIAAVGVVLLALVAVILPSLATSVFSNPVKCPTGDAICSVSAGVPGAVSIMSVFIVLVIILAIGFVIFYIGRSQ